MKKFLIVTADDFGLHEAVNEAVDRASAGGVLTAASLMVGAPATEAAVQLAREAGYEQCCQFSKRNRVLVPF